MQPPTEIKTTDLPHAIGTGLVDELRSAPSTIRGTIQQLPGKVALAAIETQNALLNNTLFALSALLVIPIFISLRYQPRLITMILTTATFYINIYHYSREEKFFTMDFVWSSILTFTSLVILYLGWRKYGPTPKIVIGGVIGVIALYIYLFYGYFPDDVKDPRSVNGYLKYHAAWHVLGLISLCIILTIRVDLSNIIKLGH